MWEKKLGEFAGRHPWRGDFPLDPHLPGGQLVLDLSALKAGIHPMVAVRLRLFMDWHSSRDREVSAIPPVDREVSNQLKSLGVIPGSPAGETSVGVIPVTRFRNFPEVEEISSTVRELLEYDRTDLAHLGEATFMVISELCGNAVEHSASNFSSYVAAATQPERPGTLIIAIADLGIGIPEHLRRAFPEWADDSAAIAKATFDHVSGTGDPHRGFGWGHVFDAALQKSLHAAEFEIYSANGFLRTKIFDGHRDHWPSPPPQYRKGTSIVCKLESADG